MHDSRRPLWVCLLALVLFMAAPAPGVAANVAAAAFVNVPPGEGYVARQEGLRSFFQAVAAHLGTSIIVSKQASARQISGQFDFAEDDIVGRLCRQLGLVNYHDGNAIYIYDASETRNSMMTLKHIRVSDVRLFLQRSGLADPRYPLRGDGASTFYVAGPPIYVDTVLRTAEFLDSRKDELGDQRVEVIRLNNTFVTDRSYASRDDAVVVPGIASIIEKLLSDGGRLAPLGAARPASLRRDAALADSEAGANALQQQSSLADALGGVRRSLLLGGVESGNADGMSSRTDRSRGGVGSSGWGSETARLEDVRVIAYPETNSLLVKGTVEQIAFVRSVVMALDEKKRHVELALWIIDVQKDDLDQLGVNWRGQVSVGKVGASFNAGSSLNSFSSLEGDRFTAAILALTRENKANIVSRPVVLTQENTPALFDSSRTFYTQLIAERAVDLQHVTYGTLVHVLPRFTAKDEIELSLNIEDGNEVRQPHAHEQGRLPEVSRTKISTVARVPKGKSLLVGGYSRGESGEQINKIPFLGDLPLIGGAFRYRETQNKSAVRVFLIRPREITDGLDLEAPPLEDALDSQGLIDELAQRPLPPPVPAREDLYHGS